MTSSQTKSGILTIPLKPGLLVNLVMLVRQPEAYIGAQAATRYFQRFIDIFLWYLLPKHQTRQELPIFYQHWTYFAVIYHVLTFKGFASFDFNRWLITLKLMLDYAMIWEWPGSYSAYSSDYAIRTWIKWNFNK